MIGCGIWGVMLFAMARMLCAATYRALSPLTFLKLQNVVTLCLIGDAAPVMWGAQEIVLQHESRLHRG